MNFVGSTDFVQLQAKALSLSLACSSNVFLIKQLGKNTERAIGKSRRHFQCHG